MTILAIDPGSEQSAWVLFDGVRVLQHGIGRNEDVLFTLENGGWTGTTVNVLEQIESYGMAVGREVFETVFWTGRFFQAAEENGAPPHRMPRREVKLHLCQSARAKDANVRAAVLDKFGGKDKAIGKKSSQGPLYGVKKDCWQALALAITWYELHQGLRVEEAVS